MTAELRYISLMRTILQEVWVGGKKEVLQYKQVSFQLKKKKLKQDSRFHIHTYMYETHQIKTFPLISIVPRKLQGRATGLSRLGII